MELPKVAGMYMLYQKSVYTYTDDVACHGTLARALSVLHLSLLLVP